MLVDERFEKLCSSHDALLERYGVPLEEARSMLWRYWCRLSAEEKEFKLDPEALAYLILQEVGLQIAETIPGATVVDALCGAGGMTIALARCGRTVTAIELSAARLAMARHNAEVFGVAERITFIRGDAREVVPRVQADAVFLAPEWGRADYFGRERTRLSDCIPDLGEMISVSFLVAPNVICQVPGNFVMSELGRFGRQFERRAFDLESEVVCHCVYFK